MVGTLRFIAPERFRGISDLLGDVYSLGATLYELLTLKPAFAERDQARIIDQIAHEPPAPLRRHDHRIPRDLETLVLKALAKDPRDRFATAATLGEELRRYLESRPIQSRPVGPAERLWRWCKRSPGLAAASIGAALLATTLLIGSIIVAWTVREQLEALRVERGKTQEALLAKADAEREAQFRALDGFHSRLNAAMAKRFSGQIGQRFDSLDALEQAATIAGKLKLTADHLDRLRDEVIACLTHPDLKATGRVIHRPPGVLLVAFDSTLTRYALRFKDGTVTVCRVADDAEIDRFQARGDRSIIVFWFSPNGRYLATTHSPGLALTVRDVNRRTVALDDPGPIALTAVRFTPDSRSIALYRQDGTARIYELATGRQSGSWAGPASAKDLAFRPDGARIATLYIEQSGDTCRVLESGTGRLVRSIPMPSRIDNVAWSPDGTTLATTCRDYKIYLWDADTGIPKGTLQGATNDGLRRPSIPPARCWPATAGNRG